MVSIGIIWCLWHRDPIIEDNNLGISAASVCAPHKSRWQVELFFKWIKQHLRIKRFFGISEKAAKSQMWITVATYGA